MQPSRLGPYVICGRLGGGGMGVVYEAADEATGAVVAVKTLGTHLGDDAGLKRRFATEIETLKALRHPGIVRLLAFGEEDGQPYYAMELVRGRSLEQLLREGRRFTWRETVATALEVTRALKAAHDRGVVHRDLKPGNLLFAAEPADGITVKLADFGIARLFGDAGQTNAGTIVGTAEYMAPEQAAGNGADHRSDLYALGLVMFAMLAGRPPFRGGRVVEIIERQRREAPPRIASLVPDVPAELDALIDRMLAKDPARRPAGALALGRLLSAIETVHSAGAAPAAGGPAPATSPVDLMADTREMPARSDAAVIPADATRREVAADALTLPGAATGAAAGSAPATTPNPGRGPTAQSPRTRFTTVAELDQASHDLAARTERRDRLARAAAALVTLAALAAVAWIALRPESADDLHARIMAIAADDDADLRDARPLIDRFLDHHAADPRSESVRALDRALDLDALERRARRRPLAGRAPGPLERDYRAALAREPESPSACLAALDAILDVHADAARDPDGDLWLALVRRQIDRLAPLADRERADDLARAEAALAEAADLARQAAAAEDPARRNALETRRRELLSGLVEMYGPRPHAAAAVARARAGLADAEPR
ncbi:MAG: serine/threonine-protein kinase [Planctomycetaceae bacterium]